MPIVQGAMAGLEKYRTDVYGQIGVYRVDEAYGGLPLGDTNK